ncbi:MAG: homocysteine S-methyltransferase family protein [Planctomycetes bacterium]|nr:homocysteine S-methyltransferase family protein [Planctomycetota bacterium]
MSFAATLSTLPFILTEGALIERLRRNPAARLDPHVEHAGLIYEPAGRAALGRLWRGYLDVGRDHDLPMIVCSPTWRASSDRLRAAGFGPGDDVNGDGVRCLAAMRDEYGDYARHVYIGGLSGCRGDAYCPAEALSEDEATVYHQPQMHALAAAGVDFLMAATLPAAGEAIGLARAMAECQVPYVLSFVVRPSGTLLDGTPLSEAVTRIDRCVSPAPLAYFVNCVHPTAFAAAMRRSAGVRERVLGLQANTSPRPPEDLDGRETLDGEAPGVFADALLDVQREFGTRILGGCCGTDERHIRCIAEAVRATDN